MAPRLTGPVKSSCNAGELSRELYLKFGLKQFYNGGKQFKNIEPVPQSGFRLGPGSILVDKARSDVVRMKTLQVNASLSYVLVFTPGKVDIYRQSTRLKVATLSIPALTETVLPRIQFYAQGNTVGIFHPDIWHGIRLLRNKSDETDWSVSSWPFDSLPTADLGGSYTKTVDEWEMYVRYSDDTQRIHVQITVNGEKTESVSLKNSGGVTIDPDDAADADWTRMANDIATGLHDLPSLSNDATCTFYASKSESRMQYFKFRFPGDLAGEEYELDAQITNTATASALVAHTKIGETIYEDLISDSRGGFSGMAMNQDRAVYFAPKARQAALAQSATAEYFDLNIKKQSDSAARLDAIRTETGQEILHVIEDAYLLVFTDQMEWFVSNRTVKQSETFNFVNASEIGTARNVTPQKFDGRMFFISKDRATLYSIEYDAVGENYKPVIEDLLATHLVKRVKRMCTQRSIDNSPMPRLWLCRTDGRLIYGIVVASQEITAFVEWVPAAGGSVLDIELDGADFPWIVVDRDGVLTIEVIQEASSTLFQCAVSGTTDLTGHLSGLSTLEGKEVWGRVDGRIVGPFIVNGGGIDTDYGSSTAILGLWQPPVFESMEFYRTDQNDEVLLRPASVKQIKISIIDTESIAIGANGLPPKNYDLSEIDDDLSKATPPKTKRIDLVGIKGAAVGPTIKITQTEPGLLQVRDFVPGVKY